MDDLQALKDRLRQHGGCITQQRAIILEALCDLHSHASVEQVRDLDHGYRAPVAQASATICVLNHLLPLGNLRMASKFP